MAFETTKRIKGRDYRYRVEAYRDPQMGKRKTRWQYLGAVEDCAALLRFRVPSNLTVPIIAKSAGVSQRNCDECLLAPPPQGARFIQAIASSFVAKVSFT